MTPTTRDSFCFFRVKRVKYYPCLKITGLFGKFSRDTSCCRFYRVNFTRGSMFWKANQAVHHSNTSPNFSLCASLHFSLTKTLLLRVSYKSSPFENDITRSSPEARISTSKVRKKIVPSSLRWEYSVVVVTLSFQRGHSHSQKSTLSS